MIDPDAQTARTLTLVAIIIQLIFFVLVGIFLFLIDMVLTSSFFTVPVNGTPAGFNPAGIYIVVIGIISLIGLFWILLDYFLIYKPLGEGNVRSTESPAIILGILQLLIGGFIPGILIIIAWIKIRDSLRNKTITSANNL